MKGDLCGAREGLGRILKQCIDANPPGFAALAPRCIGLDPTYVRHLLWGFQQAAQRCTLPWTPIIELAEWIMDQPREILGRAVTDIFDADADWGPARRPLTDLLTAGLGDGPGQIPGTSSGMSSTNSQPILIRRPTANHEQSPQHRSSTASSSGESATLPSRATSGEFNPARSFKLLWQSELTKKDGSRRNSQHPTQEPRVLRYLPPVLRTCSPSVVP